MVTIGTYTNLPTFYPTVPSPSPTDTCFSQTEVPNPKICKAHYGQTVSAKWLLLADYRHLPMAYLIPYLPHQTEVLTPPLNTCLANCGQTATEAAWLLSTAHRNLPYALSNDTIADPYGHLFSQNRGLDAPHKKTGCCHLPGSAIGYPSNIWASCYFSLLTNLITDACV